MLYIFCKRKIRTAKHGSGLSNAGQSPKGKDGQNKKRKLAATEPPVISRRQHKQANKVFCRETGMGIWKTANWGRINSKLNRIIYPPSFVIF